MMKAPLKLQCYSCRFMREDPADTDPRIKAAYCHRNPPSPYVRSMTDLGRPRLVALWPSVSYTDWCGEYQPKHDGE